jgi:uncharacterized protein DUF1835
MLHIHNGDSSAGTLKMSDVAGEHLPFRENLMAGPTPQGLTPADWRSVRARFLAADVGHDEEKCRKDLADQDEALSRFRDHEEVVLWFEHDLFCQINLIYLLAWFHEQPPGGAKLSRVCVNEFLGPMSPEQMASLFDKRHEVSAAEFQVAAMAWRAYCSSDPEDIENLLGKDTSALPYLRDALFRHLARFPSKRNGLGLVENRALQLIADGRTTFKSLFPAFWGADPDYGMGDAGLWGEMKRLGRAKEPLIIISGFDDWSQDYKSNGFLSATFTLTEIGREVLAGRSDFIDVNSIDLWFGGAHLTADNLWRWDEQNRKLIRA